MYGCIKCGVINGDLRRDELMEDIVSCGECGAKTIITFQQALDLLNDLHLKGLLPVYEVDETEYPLNEPD